MEYRPIITTLALLVFSIPNVFANGNQLDYPHSISNGVNCIDCHYAPSVDFLRAEWKNDPPNHIDDTPFNNFCLHCHNGSAAQAVETHSSRTTTPQYAPWNIECITCHWPHHLIQYRTYGAESFVASGISSAVDAVSITVGGASFGVNEFQGMILIPDLAKETFNYKIDSNTSDTILVVGTMDAAEIVPGKSFAIVYGKLVKSTIPTPNSGDKQVRFFRNSGANSFADGDVNRDGPCEVCHTMTRHFRNDGSGPEQNHENLSGGQQGVNCVGECHRHVNGFAHGSGSGGTGCGDADTCHGLQKSHPTHVGPIVGIGCEGCHDVNNFPFFRDGETLAATTACDNCHSVDGAAQAKQYFGQLGSWAAQGDQSYCASCHNDTPGYTNWDGGQGGEYALNITGDNLTYGFFVTGHGRTLADGNFPNLLWQEINTADLGNPPAERICGDCHDLSSQHFNADPAEKRLKIGFENDANNSNCNQCHAAGGSPVAAVADPQFYSNYGDYMNSAHSGKKCSDCHDVHGMSGSYPAMTKGNAQQLCYECHKDQSQPIADEYGGGFGVVNDALANHRPGGYATSDDIQEAFSSSRIHDLGTIFSTETGTYALQCTSCHNVHIVTGRYWDAEQNLSPVTRFPGNAEGFSVTNAWGDEPGEKMDDFAALGSGTGGWYFGISRGGILNWDQPAVYQPPKQGGGFGEFEFSGNVLPDYNTFCLDCHSNRVSDAIPPVNWGQGIPCTDNGVDPPNQRVECGGDHGLGVAGRPYAKDDHNPITAANWGTSGNPDQLFSMNYVTRGRGDGHFMRWPYDSAERNAGINFVLACTDCHEAHGSSRGAMMRERFNVNENGDCGVGGNPDPDGENCSDGGNWNQFCNSCHYYYGEQHAEMSCGNASCHEANSIHRIIHTTDSGAGAQLLITDDGDDGAGTPWSDYYQRPDFTPDITSAQGQIGSNELAVTFAAAVWTDLALTEALNVEDFLLFDKNNDNSRDITGVIHSPGDSTATLIMSAPLIEDDFGRDLLAAEKTSIWNWYDGGYENWATGILPAGPAPAGPWPVALTPLNAFCPVGVTDFQLNEAAGALFTFDEQNLVAGTISNPGDAFLGNGYFNGNENLDTWIQIDAPECMKEADTVTIETRVFTGVVDLDYVDVNPANGIDDDYDEAVARGAGDECCSSLGDGRNSTQQRIFERQNTIQLTIFRGNWAGDQVAARAGKARVQVKYFVDAASRHTCPNPQWPEDPYVGNDAWWHQISSDIDEYPLVQGHWYQIKVVFNSDKSGISGSTGVPVDIFADDQGTDGADSGELWSGYQNVSQTINESSTCRWGALPGDFMAAEAQVSFVGDNFAHNDIPGNTNNQLFKGAIDWLTWKPVADYGGVDALPH